MPWLLDMDSRMVRTDQYKHIHWTHHPDLDELYDLRADPYEMDNLMDVPALAQVRADLRDELGKLTLAAMGLSGAP